jgi:hypothetical protein
MRVNPFEVVDCLIRDNYRISLPLDSSLAARGALAEESFIEISDNTVELGVILECIKKTFFETQNKDKWSMLREKAHLEMAFSLLSEENKRLRKEISEMREGKR